MIAHQTKLSVNVNKFALLRNARNQDTPNLGDIVTRCIALGCHGITVHPRPDERHIRFDDLWMLDKLIKQHPAIEFNVEGYPSPTFIETMCRLTPHQVTLVPDPPDALTSSFGWDLSADGKSLQRWVNDLQSAGIRCSIFIDPCCDSLPYLTDINPDRVELYTYNYSHGYQADKARAIAPYRQVADWIIAHTAIGMNAGHDLNLENLGYLLTVIPEVQEVSIGHQLVCDCLNFGLDSTIKQYLSQLTR